MDIPAFLPTETGESMLRKMSDGRAFLIHRLADGWTFIEHEFPGNNGAVRIHDDRWLVITEHAGTERRHDAATWDAVEHLMRTNSD